MSIFRKTATIQKEKIVEVDRIVLGEPHRVRLFHAYSGYKFQPSFIALKPYEYLGTYLSCKEAFDAYPGCSVEELSGIRIGDEYFICRDLEAVSVTRPKRRRKA